jgi:hypothetical protein
MPEEFSSQIVGGVGAPSRLQISASGDPAEKLMVSDLRETVERQNENLIHPDIPAGYGSSLRRAIWQQYPRAASSLQ